MSKGLIPLFMTAMLTVLACEFPFWSFVVPSMLQSLGIYDAMGGDALKIERDMFLKSFTAKIWRRFLLKIDFPEENSHAIKIKILLPTLFRRELILNQWSLFCLATLDLIDYGRISDCRNIRLHNKRELAAVHYFPQLPPKTAACWCRLLKKLWSVKAVKTFRWASRPNGILISLYFCNMGRERATPREHKLNWTNNSELL